MEDAGGMFGRTAKVCIWSSASAEGSRSRSGTIRMQTTQAIMYCYLIKLQIKSEGNHVSFYTS